MTGSRKTFEAHGHACVICWAQGEGLVTWHHLYTKAAFPEYKNASFNLIPVCQMCHLQFHAKGTAHMAEKFSRVKDWLCRRGWVYDSFAKKWTHGGESEPGTYGATDKQRAD